VLDLLTFTPYGLFSIPPQVMVTYVVMFTLLGVVLQLAGLTEFFMNLSKALVSRSVGGVAKIAIITSAFFGTISGSSVANMYATGSFTISSMIGLGYPKEFAAAIEAVASSGGQITPPVLRSAAFVMAEILEMSYVTIIVASAIPTFVYYVSVYVQVHYTSVKLRLKGLPKEEIPSLKEVLRNQGYSLIPLIVLVYLLVVVRWSPAISALMTFYVTVVLSILRKDMRKDPLAAFRKVLDGSSGIVTIIVAAAAAGMIVGILTYTGITLRFGSMVMSASFGIHYLALLYTALLTILLDFGLSTTASYIMASAVAVPALSMLDIKDLPAHLFIFYLATRSSLTPPVALAAYAVANIAKAPPMRVRLNAVKFGLITFIIPFVFVLKPELLLVAREAPVADVAWTLLTSIIASASISLGLVRYMRQRFPVVQRMPLIACGLAMFFSTSVLVYIASNALITFLIAYHVIATKKAATTEVNISNRNVGH